MKSGELRSESAALLGPRVRLDWRAYFHRFSAEHGGEPVLVEDPGDSNSTPVLLFRDGWRYSARSYAGPEVPPPDDPAVLAALVRTYWKLRLALVRDEQRRLARRLENLKRLSEAKSAPLQQRVTFWDPDLRRAACDRGDVDFGAMQARLDWLGADVADCEGKLNEAGATQKGEDDD